VLGNKDDFRLSTAEIVSFYMIRFFVPRAFISFTSRNYNDYFNKIILPLLSFIILGLLQKVGESSGE